MRRSTWIYLLLALATLGVYYYLNNRVQPQEIADIGATLEPTEEVAYLFDAGEGILTGIRVESKAGEVVEVARDAENAWALILPIEAAAEQGSAEAAASQIATIRIDDRISTVAPKDVGLDAPEYKLTVKFDGGVERIAEVGVVTPTGGGYYVRANDEIVIVSIDAIDSLIGLLTNPPYAETPTPSPIPPTVTPTQIPSSTPEAGAADNATATPTP